MNCKDAAYGWIMILALFGLSVAGCATAPKKTPAIVPDAGTVQVRSASQIPGVPMAESVQPVEGSLWTDSARMLFVDKRARRVGDTVIVDIIENTSSSMDANTTAGRSSSIDAAAGNLLGYMRALEAKNRNLNRDQSGSLTNRLLSATMNNEFKGTGSSDRSGQVTASIGATVARVLPNGNLVLVGKREMKVNNELQLITVAGIARPRDIGSDNRIKSVYLADSRIEYFGKGVLADKQQPGWMTRILDHVWPF